MIVPETSALLLGALSLYSAGSICVEICSLGCVRNCHYGQKGSHRVLRPKNFTGDISSPVASLETRTQKAFSVRV